MGSTKKEVTVVFPGTGIRMKMILGLGQLRGGSPVVVVTAAQPKCYVVDRVTQEGGEPVVYLRTPTKDDMVQVMKIVKKLPMPSFGAFADSIGGLGPDGVLDMTGATSVGFTKDPTIPMGVYDHHADPLELKPDGLELACTFCGKAGGEEAAMRGDASGEYIQMQEGIGGKPRPVPVRARRVFWMGLCVDCSTAHVYGKMVKLAKMLDHAQKVVDGKV